jgi:dihydropteroate synthase
MTPTYFDCGRFRFSLGQKNAKPLVMGVLNVTPDSFSDGGRYISLDSALSRAEQMIEEGVDIIDIGGESSRPGAQALSLQEEMDRVIPVIFALRDCGRPLSIDTYKPEIMREAILAGVDMINDIHGFKDARSHKMLAENEVALCVMHMQNNPSTMQIQPQYVNVLDEVQQFLSNQVQILINAGVDLGRLCIDPGFGFGKSLPHNLSLLRGMGSLKAEIKLPVLAGLSRKSMLGQITTKPTEQRLGSSLAAALVAINQGASIVRVHDVAETVDAIAIWRAVYNPTNFVLE